MARQCFRQLGRRPVQLQPLATSLCGMRARVTTEVGANPDLKSTRRTAVMRGTKERVAARAPSDVCEQLWTALLSCDPTGSPIEQWLGLLRPSAMLHLVEVRGFSVRGLGRRSPLPPGRCLGTWEGGAAARAPVCVPPSDAHARRPEARTDGLQTTPAGPVAAGRGQSAGAPTRSVATQTEWPLIDEAVTRASGCAADRARAFVSRGRASERARGGARE